MPEQPRITAELEGELVRLRIDRPGIAAVSVLEDPRELINQIAEAAGLTVIIEE